MAISETYKSVDRRTRSRPFKQVRDPAVVCAAVAALEGVVVACAFMISALFYHFVLLEIATSEFALGLYIAFAIILGGLYAAFSATAASRFLNGERRRDTTLPFSFFGWTAAFAAMLMIAFLSGTVGDLSRVSLTAAYVLGTPLVVVMRGYVQGVLSQQILQGELRFQKIAMIGERADVVAYLLNSNLWQHGHEVTSTLYLEDALRDGTPQNPLLARFASEALKQGARYIVIAGDIARIDELQALISELKRFSLNVVYAPAAQGKPIEFLDVVPIGPNNTLRVLRKPLSDVAVFFKRMLDVLGAGLGLLLLSPLMLVIAILIKLDSSGPVIYRQVRRGFNGEPFTILKFRSMTVMESGYAMHQAEPSDSRITKIGRFIRATSIDELPQLINVLTGEMSLVGPRPHAIIHDDALGGQLAEYAHRQRIKPGITGWAQVNGYRGVTSTIEQIQGRTSYDLFYIDNCSIFLDLWVLLLTVFSPKTRSNAF
jgi:exopolysaccharide biosynthesis polyprenyl glycosylphosphotransferase